MKNLVSKTGNEIVLLLVIAFMVSIALFDTVLTQGNKIMSLKPGLHIRHFVRIASTCF